MAENDLVNLVMFAGKPIVNKKVYGDMEERPYVVMLANTDKGTSISKEEREEIINMFTKNQAFLKTVNDAKNDAKETENVFKILFNIYTDMQIFNNYKYCVDNDLKMVVCASSMQRFVSQFFIPTVYLSTNMTDESLSDISSIFSDEKPFKISGKESLGRSINLDLSAEQLKYIRKTARKFGAEIQGVYFKYGRALHEIEKNIKNKFRDDDKLKYCLLGIIGEFAKKTKIDLDASTNHIMNEIQEKNKGEILKYISNMNDSLENNLI